MVCRRMRERERIMRAYTRVRQWDMKEGKDRHRVHEVSHALKRASGDLKANVRAFLRAHARTSVGLPYQPDDTCG